MRFEVRNLDGSISNTKSATSVSPVQVPVLRELSPSRIEAGSGAFELTLSGSNFSSLSKVLVAHYDNDPEPLSPTVIDSTELRLIVPTHFVSTVDVILVSVQTGGLTSNTMGIKVVPPGLPSSPILDSIDRSQVDAESEGLWVTLNGGDFLDGDSLVTVGVIGDFLTTKYVSPTELQARVPESLLKNAGYLDFRVQSIQDPDIVSESRVLEILDVSGLPPEPELPSILSIMPAEIPYVAPEGAGEAEVVVRGEGFQDGATIYASLDDGPMQVIDTTPISPQELRGILNEDWRKRELRFSYIAETQSGSITATRIIEPAKPHVSISYIEPTTFFDRFDADGKGMYLLDKGGASNRRTFKINPQGFQIVVEDPSEPDLRKSEKASVTLIAESTGVGGGRVDRIDNVKMEPAKGDSNSGRFDIGDRRVVVVTDAVDDGEIVSKDGTKFSPDDGKEKDPTIRAGVGDSLVSRYFRIR